MQSGIVSLIMPMPEPSSHGEPGAGGEAAADFFRGIYGSRPQEGLAVPAFPPVSAISRACWLWALGIFLGRLRRGGTQEGGR